MASPSDLPDQQTTVLVLEDEEGLADLYTAWLSEAYDVRTANTASEAREKFDEDVDVAFIDRRLPKESGDEVVAWISQHYPQCRRAMVTAVNPDVDIVEMPFEEYVQKPVDGDDLLDVVDRLLDLDQYDDSVDELYAVVQKRVTLEAELPAATLEDDDEYQRLCERERELEAETEAVTEDLDDDGFAQLF